MIIAISMFFEVNVRTYWITTPFESPMLILLVHMKLVYKSDSYEVTRYECDALICDNFFSMFLEVNVRTY